jgi:hypothetical protein
MRKFEIETIFDSHSESHYVRMKKEADKIFNERKEEFKTNEEIKEITLNLVTLKDDEIIKEPLERVERKVKE